MVRKSLRRAFALGMSRAVRDEAAIGAACPEPAHGANAGSGKQLFWHFPLLEWHTVLLVPVLGGGCRDMDFLLALTPARCLSGYSAGARSWDGSVRAEPCLLCCLDAGLSSCPHSLPILLCGFGHCPLAEPFLLPRVGIQPWSWAGTLPFQCQVLHVGILVWRGERMVSPVGSRAPRLPGSGCRAIPCPATLALPCKQRCPALGCQQLEGLLALW